MPHSPSEEDVASVPVSHRSLEKHIKTAQTRHNETHCYFYSSMSWSVLTLYCDAKTETLQEEKGNCSFSAAFQDCVIVSKLIMTHHDEVHKDTAGIWTDANYKAR